MKMLLIVFRDSLEEEIHALLKEHGVKAFTEMHKVAGVGETGRAFHSFTWPGLNGMILTALPDDQVERVVDGLKSYRDERMKAQRGAKFPLRVFAFPCDLVV
jgi:nitrogen regulatory protein PII